MANDPGTISGGSLYVRTDHETLIPVELVLSRGMVLRAVPLSPDDREELEALATRQASESSAA